MSKKKKNDLFITDTGILIEQKKTPVTLFVFICRALSIVLIVLGVMALYVGNM